MNTTFRPSPGNRGRGDGKSTAAPFAGYVFWIIFFIIGGNVLLTLFIGVITTSMEEAQSQQKEEKQNEADIEEAATSIGFSKVTVANFRLVFNLLNLDRDGTLDEDSTSSYTGAVIEKNIESSQASKNGEKYKVQVEGDLESGV